jgi:PilZ domain-containing protein
MMAWDNKERRYFDRIVIPATANLFLEDDQGNRFGRIRMLGRGGFLLETNRRFPAAETLVFTIVGERDDVRRQIHAVQRYTNPEGDVGFEFQGLEPDAAVEIGVLIDKYFNLTRAAR